ncbi:MAG: HEAT repeat domain-containing protein [Candidatus Zixiibacteriota bacterium]|nr:MAG: HEAT repeat domain-containing protein [candidate division Zixibacteria bacterium]
MIRWRYSIIVFAFVALPLVLAVGSCGAKSEENANRMTDMDVKELEEKIQAKDWDALDIVDTAKQPEQALPALSGFLESEDPEIREIALNCVALVSDAGVPGILAGALSDADDDIRSFALQALQTVYNESVLNELVVNLENDDADIRGGAALLIGNIGQTSAVESLAKRIELEEDEGAKRSMKLALAKLGDSETQDEFAAGFDVPDSRVRLRAIEDLRYIADSRLAPRVAPALEDHGEGYLVSEKTEPDPKRGRVCDAAVNLVAELFDNPFSFETDEFKIYSDEEIDEARKFLESLNPEEEGN